MARTPRAVVEFTHQDRELEHHRRRARKRHRATNVTLLAAFAVILGAATAMLYALVVMLRAFIGSFAPDALAILPDAPGAAVAALLALLL